MDFFEYREGEAFCEQVALEKLAREVGTPCYVYSKASLQRQAQRLKAAFASYPTLPCYAVKANSNLSILREIFQAGFGADIVSGGELQRALKAGAQADHIIYSGVGKREDEIRLALTSKIYAFNVESQYELNLIARIAEDLRQEVRVSLRINPNIDAKTNPKIATGLFSTKFGLVEEEALQLVSRIKEHRFLKLIGIGCHIGSQIISLDPLCEASMKIAAFAKFLISEGHPLEFLDMGGGLGIQYKDEAPPEIEDYANVLISAVKPLNLKLLIEPGRVLVGNTGVLLCSVLGRKRTPMKTFLIVDGAMNDLIRPSMYEAFHEILPGRNDGKASEFMDVVGPVCETGDIFGRDRFLPELSEGALVMLRSAGAYGATMSSNYNSRPRAAEVLVDGAEHKVIRKRESIEDLWRHEII